MEASLLEKSILELLPSIPYIVDQVGSAMDWLKEEKKDDGEYIKALKVALKVANYASKISEVNFFKTNLIIASLLSNIPNALENERFKVFDTASKSVENTLRNVIIDSRVQEERGCFKALTMHITPLMEKDQEAAAIMLCGILQDLEDIHRVMTKADVKSPITREDYVILLGYTMVISNIYHAGINILNETAVILNDIQIILNELSY